MTACHPTVELEGVRLRVGERTLVRGLDLQAHPGEMWCVLGANGAGKSTLLESIAGIRRPDSGTIRLSGRRIEAWSPREAARLRSWLPQAVRDAFAATALEVVALGRHPHRSRWTWEDEEDRRLALGALDAMGVSAFAQRDVTTLSGGERQRVGIAAAIAQDAPLMLLDEPIAHLDLRHQLATLACLGRLASQSGRTILMSIHDLNLAARVATHALLIGVDGSASSGPFDEVATEPALSRAFGHSVARMRIGSRWVFVAE
jgi:iron complex transport system ATP-binding protein